MENFCKKCGMQISVNSNFCPKCGKSVSEESVFTEEASNAQQNTGCDAGENRDYYVPESNSFKKMFFSAKGRLGRWAFFKRIFLLFLFMALIAMPSFFLTLMVDDTSSSFRDVSGLFVIAFFLIAMIIIAGCISGIMLQIRRLHDIGHTGWAVLCSLIPYVNIAYMIYILFRKGTEGDNPYGPDPLR